MVECELARIVIRENSDAQYIILREKGGNRAFPIVIGPYEAAEINRKVMGRTTPRPLTHDLLRSALTELGGRILEIEVDDLRDGTFFAKLVVEQNGRTLRVDSRPSDAIALAIAEGITIRVAEHVLADASRSHEEPP
jgi:bifunctional DNase/RNase